MNLILLDESKKQSVLIEDLLNEKDHTTVVCNTTNDFLEAVDNTESDKIMVDYFSWKRGCNIYSYFNLDNKIGDIPFVVYNAPEGIKSLACRSIKSDDVIYDQLVDVEMVVSEL